MTDRGKLTTTIAVRVDDDLVAAIDAAQRERERRTRQPLSRALFVRMTLEELFIGARARANTSDGANGRDVSRDH